MTSKGSYFEDIRRMYEDKYGLDLGRLDMGISEEILSFRVKFMLEEIREYTQALGYELRYGGEDFQLHSVDFRELGDIAREPFHDDALDALVDLVVVALGTAVLHKYPFDEAWTEVLAANLQKVVGAGKRGTSFDLVKPSGWKPPNHAVTIALRLRQLLRGVRE